MQQSAQVPYATCKKPDLKSCIQCDSIYMTFWERQNYRDRDQTSGCQSLGMERGLTPKGPQEGMIWGDGTGLCPDYDSGYMTLCIYQTHRAVN